jgi:hypothetical protein
MNTFWVRFDFGKGKFIEKEFISEGELYEYLEDNKDIIGDWKRVNA